MPAGYLKLDDLNGESTDARFPGWIPIESYSFVQSRLATGAAGGASGSQKESDVTEIMVTKVHDRTSPALMQAAATGRRFITGVLVRSGMGEGVVGSAIIMEDVIISGMSFSGGESGGRIPMESLTLNFRTMKMGTMSDFSAIYGPTAPPGKAKAAAAGRKP